MLPDGCKILTYFSCIDKNFFVPMRDARGYRTRQALKNIYTLLLYYIYIYTIYINNTLPPALAVHEIYRDIFGPPMICHVKLPSPVKSSFSVQLRYVVYFCVFAFLTERSRLGCGGYV